MNVPPRPEPVPGALPCPFCGAPAAWRSRSNAFGTGASGMEAPSRALGCSRDADPSSRWWGRHPTHAHLLCSCDPHTRWFDTEEYADEPGFRGHRPVNHDARALAEWNRRAALLPEPAKDQSP